MKELLVNRNEDKYIISYIESVKIERDIAKFLRKDKYASKGSYLIKNVYFDSINNIDFYTKLAGTNIRKKVRIRVYDTNQKMCKLELKEKEMELQRKTSIWITKNDAEELIKCNYSVLVKYFKQSENAVKIYSIMTMGCYRPVCYIEYKRMAYVYPAFNTRITLDTEFKSSESNFSVFNKDILCSPIKNDEVILEIKYNNYLINFVRKILKPYNLKKTAVSKYCLGRPIYYYFNY